MPRGAVIQRAYQDRIRAEKDKEMVTTGCLWCKVKPVTTTLAEGRLWLEAHVAEHHPERVVVKRFGKRRSSHRMLGKQSIEDNIAAVRAQGGAGWVSTEGQPEWV